LLLLTRTACSLLQAAGNNLSMSLQVIDWMDDGWFKAGTTSPYSSRKQAAQIESFGIIDLGDGRFHIQRAGGDFHRAAACRSGADVLGDCDCVDFRQYGAAYKRACMHLWYIKLTQAIGVC